MEKHPTFVNGYSDSLQKLAQEVMRMRYDSVREFFGYCVDELGKQANGDIKRKRYQLAILLREAQEQGKVFEEHLRKIFQLCKPHMKAEFERK